MNALTNYEASALTVGTTRSGKGKLHVLRKDGPAYCGLERQAVRERFVLSTERIASTRDLCSRCWHGMWTA